MASIVSIFRADLDVRRLALVLSLFLLHPQHLPLMHSKLMVLGVGLSVPAVLMPVMWYLWLDARSGNANYFYFQSLVCCVFLSLTVLEFVAAVVRIQKQGGKVIYKTDV